jgi:hypothetical protein
MRLIRLLPALLLLGLAACNTAPQSQAEYLAALPSTIDQPTPPFPYNSRICP